MVIDTSALVAILKAESSAHQLVRAIEEDPVRLLSAASFLATCLVIESRYGEPGARELDLLVRKAKLEIAPVTAEHAEIAREAGRRYGKGRHPAKLNFGDCFSYALAKDKGERLLCVGDDFSKTDLDRVALS